MLTDGNGLLLSICEAFRYYTFACTDFQLILPSGSASLHCKSARASVRLSPASWQSGACSESLWEAFGVSQLPVRDLRLSLFLAEVNDVPYW